MMDENARYRDEELGRALQVLDVPEHAPGFYAQLHQRLAEEHTSRIGEARRRQRIRRARVRWGVRLGAAAAVAAIVAVAIGLPRIADERGPSIGVERASAAEIKARVRAALIDARTLRGRFVVVRAEDPVVGGHTTSRGTFVLTAGGDFHLVEPGREVAYDARRGTYQAYDTRGAEFRFAQDYRGVAPGPPDTFGQIPVDTALERDYGSIVRAFLASEDARVRDVTYDGRPAWRLDVAVTPNLIVPELSADHLSITVDRETGVPVRVRATRKGRIRSEVRLENLVVDAPAARREFRIEFPPGIEVHREDFGFCRVPLSRVEAIVGYTPLVPTWAPRGYELAEVAVAERGSPTGSEGGNPLSEMVVSLAYRRGFDEFLITTRLTRPPNGLAPEEGGPPVEELWSDPLATGEGFRDEPERITIRTGAVAGVDAELLIVPRNVPHIWALTDKLVVTISGDLSRAELIRAAESLTRER